MNEIEKGVRCFREDLFDGIPKTVLEVPRIDFRRILIAAHQRGQGNGDLLVIQSGLKAIAGGCGLQSIRIPTL
jgi:hypothetical protein